MAADQPNGRPLVGRRLGDRRLRVDRPHAEYFRYSGEGTLVALAGLQIGREGIGQLSGGHFVRVVGRLDGTGQPPPLVGQIRTHRQLGHLESVAREFGDRAEGSEAPLRVGIGNCPPQQTDRAAGRVPAAGAGDLNTGAGGIAG